ncbi:hypothetical protein BDV35DRAFT_346050 [Aspergillus flavus]|uniref:Uncharacterized protein n=1 Tax=Aspergillus flavus TaxID=5059 RepID=A0A5N6H390_ASPFL|nr:hypothetical protein BDV35DRAFT_346050 [Aspergillus flavus]
MSMVPNVGTRKGYIPYLVFFVASLGPLSTGRAIPCSQCGDILYQLNRAPCHVQVVLLNLQHGLEPDEQSRAPMESTSVSDKQWGCY